MNRHTIKSIRKLTWPTVLVRETYRNTRRRLPCCRVLSNSRYVVGLSVFARQSCYVPNPLVCQNQVYLLLYRTETTLTVAHPMRGRGPANKPRENTVVGGRDPPELELSATLEDKHSQDISNPSLSTDESNPRTKVRSIFRPQNI